MQTLGWKIARPDMTTHNGFQWPMSGVLEARAAVPGGPCPEFPGDGYCVAMSVFAASSGGIPLAGAVGLWLAYDERDVLGEGDGKVRVRRVEVLGTFDPISALRRGAAGADLRGADLTGADLTGANLTGADLTGADLRDAYLTSADLTGADLTRAYLTRAYLTGADLTGADLTGADLTGANLTGADLTGADLTGAYLTSADLRGALS